MPTQFVGGALRDALTTDGKVNLRIWELALAFVVRDALRSGNLYLAESRHYVSFWKLIYSDDTWSQRRERAYADLRSHPSLTTRPTRYASSLTKPPR